MKHTLFAALLTLCATSPALAWSDHAKASYRAFEGMPEVAQAAAVPAEPLESFLAAQAQPIAQLLAQQAAWAQAQLPHYPPLPAPLRFDAQVAKQGPQALRTAFLTALRVSPESRLALYIQPDPWATAPQAERLAHNTVSALPERDKDGGGHTFVRLRPGEAVAPLAVLASASDEPDYGMDVNLWEDNPSPWGRRYGFGKIPFGNPNLEFTTQGPFHMGFYYESPVIYMAASFLRRTYPLLRIHQYKGLSELAFRSGHPYWGWRFAGLAMHYLQDLTQPYHASLAPDFSTVRLMGINLLSILGMPNAKNDMIILLSNRHFVLERYESQMIQAAAQTRKASSVEQALHDTRTDAAYPAWSDQYVRDTVARQSHEMGITVTTQMLATVPTGYVNNPRFDFGLHAKDIDLMAEVARQGEAPKAALESTIATLMRNAGAHSRNMVRGILRDSGKR